MSLGPDRRDGDAPRLTSRPEAFLPATPATSRRRSLALKCVPPHVLCRLLG